MRVRNVGWSKKEMWRKSTVFHTWNSECASFCFFFVMSPAIFVSRFCTVSAVEKNYLYPRVDI
jgi:hypothetical protein